MDRRARDTGQWIGGVKGLCVCGRELTPHDGFGLEQVAGEAMTYSISHAGVAGKCAIPAPMVRDVLGALVSVEGYAIGD